MCLNHEMIELKEKVIQTLVVGEELLLIEFFRQNLKLKSIPPANED